jgi:hypothetical protein
MGLWARVQAEYAVVDVGGAEILCLAGEALDRAESLSAAIAEDGPVIRGRTGIKVHPIFGSERARRRRRD